MQNVANAQFSVNLALGIDTYKNTIDSGGVFPNNLSSFVTYGRSSQKSKKSRLLLVLLDRYRISGNSFRSKNSVYLVKNWNLRQLFEFPTISKFKKELYTRKLYEEIRYSFPSWLVWGRNQVYWACCFTQTAHIPV